MRDGWGWCRKKIKCVSIEQNKTRSPSCFNIIIVNYICHFIVFLGIHILAIQFLLLPGININVNVFLFCLRTVKTPCEWLVHRPCRWHNTYQLTGNNIWRKNRQSRYKDLSLKIVTKTNRAKALNYDQCMRKCDIT